MTGLVVLVVVVAVLAGLMVALDRALAKAWRARAADELTRITEEDGLYES